MIDDALVSSEEDGGFGFSFRLYVRFYLFLSTKLNLPLFSLSGLNSQFSSLDRVNFSIFYRDETIKTEI